MNMKKLLFNLLETLGKLPLDCRLKRSCCYKEKLSSIEKARWISSLHEGLGCLNQLKNYKGRERQIVTLISSGMKVERQVTPHISFKIEVVPKNMTVEELSAALMLAQTKLVSIHNHISSVTE